MLHSNAAGAIQSRGIPYFKIMLLLCWKARSVGCHDSFAFEVRAGLGGDVCCWLFVEGKIFEHTGVSFLSVFM
jgi:hypothetical protein